MRCEKLARRFLHEHGVSDHTTAAFALTGADVVAFLLRESGRVSVGAAKGRVAELRSLLKFVYLPGLTGAAVNHGGAARRRLARLWSDGLLMTTTMRRSPRTPPHSLAKQYIR